MFYSASRNVKNMIILATYMSDGYGIYVYHQHYSNALVGACYSPQQSGPVECFPSGLSNALLAIICKRGANMAAFGVIVCNLKGSQVHHPTTSATVETALPTTPTGTAQPAVTLLNSLNLNVEERTALSSLQNHAVTVETVSSPPIDGRGKMRQKQKF